MRLRINMLGTIVGACLLTLGRSVGYGDSEERVCDDSLFQNMTDSDGHGCDYYRVFPFECGRKDDLNFTAKEMCCACARRFSGRGECDDSLFRNVTDSDGHRARASGRRRARNHFKISFGLC